MNGDRNPRLFGCEAAVKRRRSGAFSKRRAPADAGVRMGRGAGAGAEYAMGRPYGNACHVHAAG